MKTLFNDGWSFTEKEISQSLMTKDGKPYLLDPCSFFPACLEFEYTPVHIPHDWMISDTKRLYRNSAGCYQKSFNLKNIKNRHFALNFEGVYMNCAVYVNNQLAGIWKYGYTEFEFDISCLVKEGNNIVHVICIYQSPNTRWYSGAGIFRDVYLIETPSSRLITNGTYISVAKMNNELWNLYISAEIASQNAENNLSVIFSLLNKDGKIISRSETIPVNLTGKAYESALKKCVTGIENDTISKAEYNFSVKKPSLWSPETPFLYKIKTELFNTDRKLLDSVTEYTAFRTISYSSSNGLSINGTPAKIYGVCQHHDLGGLGAAFDVNALRRQFIRLKEMGVNAIRTSHNPVTRDFMNLADEMGFLIDADGFDMWEKTKTTYDYGNYFNDWCERDTASWVRKDRNHPSLIMWSIGNEIYDTHIGNGLEITKRLSSFVRTHDPLKNAPVTIASNYMMTEGAQKCAEEIELVGYNYLERLYDGHHEKYPDWKIYGSETSSTVQSRGIYHFPISMSLVTHDDRQCSSLGNCTTTWGCESTQKVITNDRDTPFSAGQFIWTGWDYIGEPTPYNNTSKSSYFGQIDTAGFPKDTYYLYKAEWGGSKIKPFVHILPYWDWNEGQEITVKAYTNMDSVELFINGRTMGKQIIDHEKGKDLFGKWDVQYEKGEIRVAAYDRGGNVKAEEIKHSYSDPVKVILKPEIFDNTPHLGNMYFIDVMTLDKDGYDVSNARNTVTVEISGDAYLVSTDNGDPTDYDQYISDTRKLFGNRLCAIVRAKTEEASFTVRVTSKSLIGQEIQFKDGCISSVKTLEPSEKGIFVPVRKIELTINGEKKLTKENRTITVHGKILPENATCSKIDFVPVLPTSVISDAVEIRQDGTEAELTALCDGNFILRATANNGHDYPEIISELNMSVEGVGNPKFNPYKLVEACRYTGFDPSRPEPSNGFTGGISTRGIGGGSWVSFDKVDFGEEGSDEINIPAFCWDPAWPLKIYDGTPDTGTLVFDGKFCAEYQYNTYTEKSFTLNRRLFGIHTISVWVGIELVWHGFRFTESPKAFGKLRALDADTITGDTFTKTGDAVEGIGNNVTLDFSSMNFASPLCPENRKKGAVKLTICGKSNIDNNTINLKFFSDSGETSRTEIIEFPHTETYEEKTFEIKPLSENGKISFIFLPGCNFDFKWFRFE